jgi:hypothetical protein
MTHRNLIISPVGDDSRHPSWLDAAAERQFDLALIYFGGQEDRYRADADHYLVQRGFKFHLIERMLRQLAQQLEAYDLIWLPDDDIASTTHDVNRLFAIAREYRLAISQPAISAGDTSYKVVRQQPGLLLRYTQFVEVMCPVLSRAALARVRSTLTENKSAWGIDWAWTRLVPAGDMAIIDAVGVQHTRPLHSGAGYERMRNAGVDPHHDLAEMTARYGVTKRRRRHAKHASMRVRAIAADGRPTWAGRPWWQFWRRAA